MTTVHMMTIHSEGEAPPFVMLVGLGGHSSSFQAMVATLSGFRVVRPDFPGAGRSPTPPQETITIGFLVEMLEGAAAHLGAQRAHVVAYSFETLIAPHLAARLPQPVASLICSGRFSNRRMAHANGLARTATAPHEGMSAVADHLSGSALASAAAIDNPMAFAFVRESHMRRDVDGFAPSRKAPGQVEKADHRLIDCLTLIVTGDEDAVGPPSIAQELAGKFYGAKTVILNRCGHWTPIEKAKECGKLLSEFVRGISI
jgi:3-oxoadipate enol-lactonase